MELIILFLFNRQRVKVSRELYNSSTCQLSITSNALMFTTLSTTILTQQTIFVYQALRDRHAMETVARALRLSKEELMF